MRASGLGEATARHLSAQGASVVLGARRQDRIQALARDLTGRDGKAIAVTTDVADREQVKALVDAAVQAYGRIDVIINNVGLQPRAVLHLIEQPIEAVCWLGAFPVAAMARIASRSSRRAPGGGAVVRPSSRRPRYLSLRWRS